MRNLTGTQKMRSLIVALSLLLCPAAWVHAESNVSVGISIGINVPVYPRLVLVPGYPVYYAPHLRMNYFFYDGMYWVYRNDGWYVSSWYNGPWYWVEPEYVPLFVLRIPVRYYRYPPPYFRGWRVDAPPRWGEYWGRDWEDRHRDWNRWDRRAIPRPAPLPAYQQRYSGDRYPRVTEQQRIQSDRYRYRPREDVTRQYFRQQGDQGRTRAAPQSPESMNPQRRMPQQEQPQLRMQPQQPQHMQQRPVEQQDRRREHMGVQQERREAVPRAQPVPPPPADLPRRDKGDRGEKGEPRGNPKGLQDKGWLYKNEEHDQDRR